MLVCDLDVKILVLANAFSIFQNWIPLFDTEDSFANYSYVQGIVPSASNKCLFYTWYATCVREEN